MRDPRRIPEILDHFSRVWKANPDFRLGQLICISVTPATLCSEVFHREDDLLLEGLLAFEHKRSQPSLQPAASPDWQVFPDISRIRPAAITVALLMQLITVIKSQNRRMILTPVTLMALNGAPVDDPHWLKGQEERLRVIAEILAVLNEMGVLGELTREGAFFPSAYTEYYLKA